MSQDYDENDFDDYTPTPENDPWEARQAIKAEADTTRKLLMLRQYIRRFGEPSSQQKVLMGVSKSAK